jgi:uncharacterized protein (DUF302 family)
VVIPKGNIKCSYKKQTVLNYQATVEKVKRRTKKEGFGVLTEIDVRTTLKKKLDASFDNYLILGACNLPYVQRALVAEEDIGLILPWQRHRVRTKRPNVRFGNFANRSYVHD